MSRFSFRILAVLALLTILIAACAPAGSDATTPNATGTQAVPGTGPAATATTGGDTGTGTASCEGVDTAQLVAAGQGVYTNQCAGCHGEQGEGQGNFPALTNNTALSGADIAALVQVYLSVDAHPKDLSGEDLAGVLSYSRSAFNNNADAVCPAQIQDLLPATQ